MNDAAISDALSQVGLERRPMPPGRPPSTSRAALSAVAMRLFIEQGYDETSVEQIATAAGVSRRTFFRYFATKSAVFWSDFDFDVQTIARLLSSAPTDEPMMDVIRAAVVQANHYRAADLPALRARMNLIATVPALQGDATVHYESWERAISEFVAARTGEPVDSMWPLVIGRTTLAACRAAFDRWSSRVDADLTRYLDAALIGLAAGFEPQRLPASPETSRRATRHVRRTAVPPSRRPAVPDRVTDSRGR